MRVMLEGGDFPGQTQLGITALDKILRSEMLHMYLAFQQKAQERAESILPKFIIADILHHVAILR